MPILFQVKLHFTQPRENSLVSAIPTLHSLGPSLVYDKPDFLDVSLSDSNTPMVFSSAWTT